jgi:hypothetical protein
MANILRRLFVIAAFTLCATAAHAQDSLLTMPEIEAKLTEANEAKVHSDDPLVVFQETEKIKEDIEDIGFRLSAPNPYQGKLDSLSDLEAAIDTLIALATVLDCQSNIDTTEEVRVLADDIYGRLTDSLHYQDPTRNVINRLLPDMRNKDCAYLKQHFSKAGLATDLQSELAKSRENLEKTIADYADRRARTEELLKVLQGKATEFQTALSGLRSEQTKLSLRDNMPLIVLVIGALGICTILAVRCFANPIQEEWVASGQVTQFVTVMMLLSVIFGLGLSGIIQEDTLGTLLGGIGGYVLSQGVGRAAAREAGRQMAAAPLVPSLIASAIAPAAPAPAPTGTPAAPGVPTVTTPAGQPGEEDHRQENRG